MATNPDDSSERSIVARVLALVPARPDDAPPLLSGRRLATIFAPLAVLLALVWFQNLVPVVELLREPKGDRSTPAYTGVVTSIGFVLWGSAIAMAGFTIAVLRRDGHDRALRWLLAGGIVLSAFFLIDDRLLVHEAFAPDRGIPEQLVVGTHGALLLGWLVGFRRVIARTDYRILALAVGLFGLTMFIDLFPDAWMPLAYDREYFFEESTKAFGIVSWFLYFAVIAYQTVVVRPVATVVEAGDAGDLDEPLVAPPVIDLTDRAARPATPIS